ncbi:hypothetical protein SUGI_0178150 [Cryptomeria japonica]|nr:hypothetical protein SUGI_0178150 [Cryptomeria japonica]
MTGVKIFLKSEEEKYLRWEVQKWGPYSEHSPKALEVATSQRRRGRPKGSKKKARTIWIGFPLDNHATVGPSQTREQKAPSQNRGKEIVIAE